MHIDYSAYHLITFIKVFSVLYLHVYRSFIKDYQLSVATLFVYDRKLLGKDDHNAIFCFNHNSVIIVQ